MVAGAMVPGGGEAEPLPTHSTPAALEAVRAGSADFACVPIENSIEGSVLPTLDSLAAGPPLQVFAELTLDVAFSIVIRPGVTPAQVRTVAAFPVAAAQVRRAPLDTALKAVGLRQDMPATLLDRDDA
jgi:prephenate dehydratase